MTTTIERLRFGFLITALLGVMYGGVGVFTSLHDVGVGIAVGAMGVIGWGACDWIEEH